MNTPQAKVLIVDDEPSIRRALHTTFGTLGYDIAEAVTGEQALPLLRASNFDAVLLDINMPGMGGIQACREIRRQFPRVAVLMLTAVSYTHLDVYKRQASPMWPVRRSSV